MPPPHSTPTSSRVEPTWVAQFVSLLQRVFTPDQSLEALEFSDILIQTLLSGDTSPDAKETDRIISVITQDLEIFTRILKPVPLRTLAALLLRSSSQRAQKIGLDLLVVRFSTSHVSSERSDPSSEPLEFQIQDRELQGFTLGNQTSRWSIKY
ncbi:hypothetical protein BJX96DRAFT_179810 [Aspergillus floccosus]